MRECIITNKNVCPHEEICGELCSPCKIPDHDPTDKPVELMSKPRRFRNPVAKFLKQPCFDKAPYVTITGSQRGYFAVKMEWYEKGKWWGIMQTSPYIFQNIDEAIDDAKEWAKKEELEYKE